MFTGKCKVGASYLCSELWFGWQNCSLSVTFPSRVQATNKQHYREVSQCVPSTATFIRKGQTSVSLTDVHTFKGIH